LIPCFGYVQDDEDDELESMTESLSRSTVGGDDNDVAALYDLYGFQILEDTVHEDDDGVAFLHDLDWWHHEGPAQQPGGEGGGQQQLGAAGTGGDELDLYELCMYEPPDLNHEGKDGKYGHPAVQNRCSCCVYEAPPPPSD
jgi:hypothetical protein